MLMSDVNLKSYSDTSYHNEELKSLTRYRFDKVKERAKLKTSVSRLVCILFPELEKLVPTLHMASVYALLSKFPSTKHVATAHLTRLTNLLCGLFSVFPDYSGKIFLPSPHLYFQNLKV